MSSHGAEHGYQGFAMPYSGRNAHRLDMSRMLLVLINQTAMLCIEGNYYGYITASHQ
jgi:hypothetical protein